MLERRHQARRHAGRRTGPVLGFELVGGEIAVAVHAAHDIWIDGCEMRDTGSGVRSGPLTAGCLDASAPR